MCLGDHLAPIARIAANSRELLASTRVMWAITSEYFRGLTAVGLSGHMIITRSGPLSGLCGRTLTMPGQRLGPNAGGGVERRTGGVTVLRLVAGTAFGVAGPWFGVCGS
jgi:hypothetical protein